MQSVKYKLTLNRFRQPDVSEGFDIPSLTQSVRACHLSVADYHATPLVTLAKLTHAMGVSRSLVKDESCRFKLQAFKALGASYAVYRFINDQRIKRGEPEITAADLYASRLLRPGQFTFCTATDGNHGRGVAWVAKLLEQRAVIYMPGGTAPSRIDKIRQEGADVIIVDGTYDRAVETARRQADQNDWVVISDTSWPGYHSIPLWISQGYLTLFAEIDAQLDGAQPDVVFVPGGVGALAATAAWWYSRYHAVRSIRLVSVEPTSADCLFRSIMTRDGAPVTTDAALDSIMAGLNCGTPSEVAWPYIRDRFDAFVTIDDDWAIEAMRRYYHPLGDDPRIISGESGAATLGALLALCNDASEEERGMIGLNKNTTVLLLNTEGATDPVNFEQVVAAHPSG